MNTVTYRKYAKLFTEAKAAGLTKATSVKAYIAELKTQILNHAEPIVEPPVVQAPVLERPKKLHRTDVTRRIFREEMAKGNIVRKQVVARFMTEAGLTLNGANTYLTNMKREFGLL